MISGSTWKEVRKFTLSQLKEGGVGTKNLEPMIEEEVKEMMGILRTKLNSPLNTKHLFNVPAFNVLWHVISSQRFSLDDPQAHDIIDSMAR